MRQLSAIFTRSFTIASLVLGAAALPVAGPAFAHHSGTMFDRTNPIAVTGTLKEFRWANPHSWLSMLVPDGKGGQDLWTLEGGSVTFMTHNGWNRTSILPGDPIKAIVAPRRDGTNGGEFMSVTNLKTGITYQQAGHF